MITLGNELQIGLSVAFLFYFSKQYFSVKVKRDKVAHKDHSKVMEIVFCATVFSLL